MKYGVLMHKTTMNLGDDIQSYASAQFLPQIDYVVDRENIDFFRSEDNEPVGVIMSAWWLWQKWNWPPAECIIPKLTGIHIHNYTIYRKASPVQNEWLEGIGGEFFRAYGPVGCRDDTTRELLAECGIGSYFSGCVTLTLPKQKQMPDVGTYVCLVDLAPELEAAAKKWLKDSGLEIRILTHHCDYRKSDASMKDRFAVVEKTLTQYQNAQFVVTRRLHAALPCLAMETPVLVVVDMEDTANITRWAPYYDWMHHVSDKDFMSGRIAFDYHMPPPNQQDYLAIRQTLLSDIRLFIDETKDCVLPIGQLKKISYTEEEAREWQNKLMHWTLERWLHQNRGLLEKHDIYKKKAAALEEILQKDVERAAAWEEFLQQEADVRWRSLCRKIKRRIKSLCCKIIYRIFRISDS